MKERLFTTKKLALMGVITALSVVLYFIEVPLPFIAPEFYKLDLSDIPIMIGSFILGPVAGVLMELVKNLIHLLITRTGGVGELANFAIGCAFVVPASLIYKYKKTVHGAIVGLAVSIVCMAIIGGLMNYFVMLPMYGVGDVQCAGLGKAISNLITDKKTLVLYSIVPFNLIKGFIDSFITLLVYKRLSEFIKKHI
ncbi:MAG: ECF transporter S component [Eubacterium sp.]|nr:ECF transporter S component [Eubacterium sp.]